MGYAVSGADPADLGALTPVHGAHRDRDERRDLPGAVYNYTRDFPYLWEEIVLPIEYDVDRDRVEQILLSAARAHAVVDDPEAERALDFMRSRYAMSDASLEPAVFWRLTDN